MTSLYVGNLPEDVRHSEIEDLFRKYGKVQRIDIKGQYGFVTMDEFAAKEALLGVLDADLRGRTLIVRLSNAHADRESGPKPAGTFAPRDRRKCVVVKNLSLDTRWQDLKDEVKKIAEVLHANIDMDGNRSLGSAIVELKFVKDVPRVTRQLDGSSIGGCVVSAYPLVSEEGTGGRDQGGFRAAERDRDRVTSFRGRVEGPERGYDRERGGTGGAAGVGRYHPYERSVEAPRSRGYEAEGVRCVPRGCDRGGPGVERGYGGASERRPDYSSDRRPNYSSERRPDYGSGRRPDYSSERRPDYGSERRPEYGGERRPDYGSERR
eukprot:RCo012671